MLTDPEAGRRRVVHALILTAVHSRRMFVWLTFSQTLEMLIDGCEAAWRFFGGVFHVLVPDNTSAIVAHADSVNPRFTVGCVLDTRTLSGTDALARADGELVKMFHHGRLVKAHPRQPPVGRSTDPGDLPAEKTAYAMRDLTRPSPRPTLS